LPEVGRRETARGRALLDQADVTAASWQVYLALFYEAQLDIGAME
jgi:hypothetical protein